MNLSAISHRSNSAFTYALDNDRVVVTLKTGKDIDKAVIICEDPFIHELKCKREWYGKPVEMQLWLETEYHYIMRAVLSPEYKRLQYYFEIYSGDECYTLFENKLCPIEKKDSRAKQYFKFPWLNPSDVIAPPQWVSDTVWYQIMPERYARGSNFVNNGKFREWGDFSDGQLEDLYGGNLRGIKEKLPYIKSLGISGIYLTPVFLSCSSHKYNTFDYRMIDPDFGTENDMIELVGAAHDMGIRIMLDAVFNHCGHDFPLWKDVQKNGRNSKYYDWFFVNGDNIDREDYSTADGRFYSFSFWAGMPKFNTNNPKVIKYFTEIVSYWTEVWGIDGIRFDVGDEVSHTFLRSIYNSLKAIKPDIFLLGEIWNDSLGWVTSKEYDSVMNYPLCNCINDFGKYKDSDSTEFMYRLNYCRSLYPPQVTDALFNFLDTHDTARAIDSCENEDVLLQKAAMLMTLPGTPCIYYGTEIAMHGLYAPFNRRTMPWDEIESGKYDNFINKLSGLIKLRKGNEALQSDDIEFRIDKDNPRILSYIKSGDTAIYINAGDKEYHIPDGGEILYSNKYDNGILFPDGTAIVKLMHNA